MTVTIGRRELLAALGGAAARRSRMHGARDRGDHRTRHAQGSREVYEGVRLRAAGARGDGADEGGQSKERVTDA
jgi:hypothetical protein